MKSPWVIIDLRYSAGAMKAVSVLRFCLYLQAILKFYPTSILDYLSLTWTQDRAKYVEYVDDDSTSQYSSKQFTQV